MSFRNNPEEVNVFSPKKIGYNNERVKLRPKEMMN